MVRPGYHQFNWLLKFLFAGNSSSRVLKKYHLVNYWLARLLRYRFSRNSPR